MDYANKEYKEEFEVNWHKKGASSTNTAFRLKGSEVYLWIEMMPSIYENQDGSKYVKIEFRESSEKRIVHNTVINVEEKSKPQVMRFIYSTYGYDYTVVLSAL